MKSKDFNYNTKDVHGIVPDFTMLGAQLLHLGNRKVYTINKFTWLGDTDEWGFECTANTLGENDAKVPVTRPLHHIEGKRSNGERRYEVVMKGPNNDSPTYAEMLRQD